MRRWLIGLIAAVSVAVGLPYTCPIQRALLSDATSALVALKNRTAIPATADYDPRVTLAAMLEPGGDETRWSDQRAAQIDGYLVNVVTAGMELANCLSFVSRDIHLEIAHSRDARPIDRVIVEVTPPMRRVLAARGVDWSTTALEEMVGRRVRVQGWLMFDREHAEESENLRPGNTRNWRATAWEIHPVTSLHLLD